MRICMLKILAGYPAPRPNVRETSVTIRALLRAGLLVYYADDSSHQQQMNIRIKAKLKEKTREGGFREVNFALAIVYCT